ncbi:MAG: hypothetical protein ACOVRK_04060 [Chryseobacterium taeanense]|jgi:hypothetical protein
MTYKQIQDEYKSKYNSSIKTCWIADTKRKMGLPVRIAYNRISETPKYPCPKEKYEEIKRIIENG